MTHTEISQAAALRLDDLTMLSPFDAVKLCITMKNISKYSSDELISKLREIKYDSNLYYFAESTTSSASDPLKKVDAQIRNGFTTGGVVFDINTVPNWKEFEKETRNIRYKAHSWLMIDALLVADQIVDHNDYLQKAIDIADDWIINFIVEKGYDEFAWYDMAVGQRGTKLPYILRRLIEISAPDEQIFRFIVAADIHICELMQEDRIATHSNHGLFQMAGLIALSKTLTWMKTSSESSFFAEKILTKMLNGHFAEDGLHLEHSPDYHLYMVNHLNSFVRSNWFSGSNELTNMIKNVEKAAFWMGNPEHNTIAIGDTANNTKVTRRWGDGGTELLIGLKIFPIGGLVIENVESEKGISQLVFSAQFHSRQHKHADDLNVLYHLNNKPLLIDSGTYTYQYDLPERIYCESTKAHNTVEIDGLNYSRFRNDIFNSALTLSKKIGPLSILGGEVLHNRLISSFTPNNKILKDDGIECEIKHTRIIIHFPERFLAIIDQLDTTGVHDFVQWNHFSPNFNIRDNTLGKLEVYDADEDIVSLVSSVDTDGNYLDAKIVKGQSQPHLQGWTSHNGRELIPNPAVGYSFSSETNCIATVFDFSKGPTGKPYIRSGSSGNYIRFALTQNRSKVDIKIRKLSNGEIGLECLIDDQQYNIVEQLISQQGK